MKTYIIHVHESDTRRSFFYKNLKAASLHMENNVEVGERQLGRLKKALLEKQRAERHPQDMEEPTGFPFSATGCWIDRIHVMGTGDVIEDNGAID